MNAAEKAEALASIRQEVGALGVGLMLGAVAFHVARPKGKATTAVEMAQRWLAWGLFAYIPAGISFAARNQDKHGEVGATIIIVCFTGLAWGLGYLVGLVKFKGTAPRNKAESSDKAAPPLNPVKERTPGLHIGAALIGVVGLAMVGLALISAFKAGVALPALKKELSRLALTLEKNEPDNIDEGVREWVAELTEQEQNKIREVRRAILENKTTPEMVQELLPMGFAGQNEAQMVLGECYEKGLGVEEDQQAAYDWYLKAGNRGDAEAQIKLAAYYLNRAKVQTTLTTRKSEMGLGNQTTDENKGAEWLLKAAKQGNNRAQRAMSELYDEGRGVIKDPVQATDWLQRAAEQGDVISQIDLARRYRDGEGRERDNKTALAWFYLAMRNSTANVILLRYGNMQQVAKEMLELENELGPESTREANELSTKLTSS